MMSENLTLWKAVERTDPNQTKQITGKPYKGTSPKPYYLVQKATDIFGPCGIGWGFEIVSERVEDGAQGDKVHIAHIRLWYKWNGSKGTVEHIGQTMFSGKRNDGKAFTDEDAPKKSVTDALVKAMSMVGFAGDIFMGRYDDSKYVDDVRAELVNEASQPDGIDESVSVYVAQALKRIAGFTLAPSLRKWWEDDAVVRRELGVINGTPEYRDLFEAFKVRGLALAPTKSEKAA